MPCRIRLASVALILLTPLARAAPASKIRYHISLRSETGGFLNRPFRSLATNRFLLDLNQHGSYSDWLKFKFSGQVRAESAYASNPSVYGGEMARQESTEATPRENYIRLQNGDYSLSLGYQQVVWGEAFGFFFADIINPKDLREDTLYGLLTMADLRTPVPMANLEWLGANSTVQFLYMPWSGKDLLPSPGSPYFPVAAKDLGLSSSANITRASQPAYDDPRGDFALRFDHTFGDLDVSLFGFQGLDRMPYYEVSSFSVAPESLTLQEHQKRITSYGFTATFDTDGWLWRLEAIRHQKRKLNYLDGTTLAAASFDESVGVIGLNTPSLGKWSLNFQLSNSLLDGTPMPLLRKKSEPIFGCLLMRSFGAVQKIELSNYVNLSDESSMTTLQWQFARSPQLEYIFGIESMQGNKNSEFGPLAPVSRVLIGIRGVFDG